MSASRHKGKRVMLTCPQNLYDVVSKLAKEESRSVAQMFLLLAQDGLKSREIEVPEEKE